MKVLTIFFIFFSHSFYCQSTEEDNKNAFYFEVLGHTRSIVSLNYERDFYRINDCFSLVARTGVGYEGGYKRDDNRYKMTVTIPTVLLVQMGKKKHFVNIGVGYSASFRKGLTDEYFTPARHYSRFDSALSFSLGYKLAYRNTFVQAYPVIIKSKNSTDDGFSFGISFGFTW